MHYYQFHIGDYRAATAHLSNEEDLAYRRLLDMYYDSEQFIPLDTHWVSRRLRVASEVIENVLFDFFSKTENGWQHTKCDELIADYQAMAEKNRINGRKGGRKKNPLGSQSDTERYPNAKPTKNHKPETINQEPIYIEPTVLVPSPKVERTPSAPISEIVEMFNTKLPQLPRCEVLNDSRKKAISARWRDVVSEQKFTKEQGLEWFSNFFEHIGTSKFLTGKVKPWRADVDFIFKPTSFARIVEGAYHKD